jgi:hypothetical protein
LQSARVSPFQRARLNVFSVNGLPTATKRQLLGGWPGWTIAGQHSPTSLATSSNDVTEAAHMLLQRVVDATLLALIDCLEVAITSWSVARLIVFQSKMMSLAASATV